MRGFDQRRLAHAARAPQQRVVGRQARGEALGVLDQHVAHAVDALEQRHVDAVDARHRREPAPVGMPDEGIGGGEIGRGRRLRRQPLERGGDALSRYVARRRPADLVDLALPVFGRFAMAGQRVDCKALLLAGSMHAPGKTGRARKPAEMRPFSRASMRHCNRAGGRYSPREIARRGRCPATARRGIAARLKESFDVHFACVCARRLRRRQRWRQHDDVAAAVSSLIFVIMYFLILRPQQKRAKQHQEMVKNVRRGDTVDHQRRPGRQGHQGGRRRPDRDRNRRRRARPAGARAWSPMFAPRASR